MLGIPSASMGAAVRPEERVRRFVMSQQIPERRIATMTQNPNATQFQEVWAGMTQWADIAGRNTRFSAQTTRFFCAAEPAELLPYLVQLLGEEKVQSNVYALTPNGAKEQHLLDINNLIEGFSQLTQEQNWKAAHDASAADDSARDSLDADDDEMMEDEPANDRPAGARLHISLVDRRKCPLSGNIWIDALPLRRRPSPINVNGSMKQIKSLVLLSRSSGSPIEWRRLFATIVKSDKIAGFVVPM